MLLTKHPSLIPFKALIRNTTNAYHKIFDRSFAWLRVTNLCEALNNQNALPTWVFLGGVPLSL
jgi:hypothetical protein